MVQPCWEELDLAASSHPAGGTWNGRGSLAKICKESSG